MSLQAAVPFSHAPYIRSQTSWFVRSPAMGMGCECQRTLRCLAWRLFASKRSCISSAQTAGAITEHWAARHRTAQVLAELPVGLVPPPGPAPPPGQARHGWCRFRTQPGLKLFPLRPQVCELVDLGARSPRDLRTLSCPSTYAVDRRLVLRLHLHTLNHPWRKWVTIHEYYCSEALTICVIFHLFCTSSSQSERDRVIYYTIIIMLRPYCR